MLMSLAVYFSTWILSVVFSMLPSGLRRRAYTCVGPSEALPCGEAHGTESAPCTERGIRVTKENVEDLSRGRRSS